MIRSLLLVVLKREPSLTVGLLPRFGATALLRFFVLIHVILWIVRGEDSIHEITRNGTNEISLDPVEGGYSSLSSALSGFIVSAA